jgi:6-phosphogluconolactonase
VALDPEGFAGTRSGCEVAVSPDGRFVYVSNRRTDEIQVFTIDRATGTPHEIQRIGCGGKVPRSFAIDPSGRWMMVANQGSGNVAVLGVDPATGRLRATGTSLAVPGPMAFVFFG